MRTLGYVPLQSTLVSQLVMIEERRWPLGNKTSELHGGGGLITTVKWKDTLIAWANSTAKVHVPAVVHIHVHVRICF